jgi:hypothetical protein
MQYGKRMQCALNAIKYYPISLKKNAILLMDKNGSRWTIICQKPKNVATTVIAFHCLDVIKTSWTGPWHFFANLHKLNKAMRNRPRLGFQALHIQCFSTSAKACGSFDELGQGNLPVSIVHELEKAQQVMVLQFQPAWFWWVLGTESTIKYNETTHNVLQRLKLDDSVALKKSRKQASNCLSKEKSNTPYPYI